jgi:hypothetical protein
MTGPRSMKRDFIILGLMTILDGRITPADRTWIPRTILVNYHQLILSSVRVSLPIGEYSWLYRPHVHPPNFLVVRIKPFKSIEIPRTMWGVPTSRLVDLVRYLVRISDISLENRQ